MRTTEPNVRKIGRPPKKNRTASLSLTLYEEDFAKLAQIRAKRGYESDSDAVRHLIRRARV